jgi:hypothetical protein
LATAARKEAAVMTLTPVNYAELNARQKEVYNFDKVAAALADFGFNCIKRRPGVAREYF